MNQNQKTQKIIKKHSYYPQERRDRFKFREGLKSRGEFSRAVTGFKTMRNIMRLSSRRAVDSLACLSFWGRLEGFCYVPLHEKRFLNKAASI